MAVGIGSSVVIRGAANEWSHYYHPSAVTTIEATPKSLPFIVGERIFKPIFASFSKISSSLAGRITSVFPRFSSVELSSVCADQILTQYPLTDVNSQAIVNTLCDNTATSLAVENIDVNNDDAGAIGAALAQNTVLTQLSFTGVYCDTSVFANSLTQALKANRVLSSLSLVIYDRTLSTILPPPVTPAAFQQFFDNLPCFNLLSLDLGPVHLTPTNAQAMSTTLQNNPFFPLNALNFTWYTAQFSDTLFQSTIDALKSSQCITEFGLGIYTFPTVDSMLTLFEWVGATNVSTLDLWCVSQIPLNSTNRQRIIDAVSRNLCFTRYSRTLNPCFSPDVELAIDDLTQNRTICDRDPRCNAPVNCSAPAVGAPSKTPASVTQQLSFQVGVGVGATIAGASLFAFMVRKAMKKNEGEGIERNRETVELHHAPVEEAQTEGEA